MPEPRLLPPQGLGLCTDCQFFDLLPQVVAQTAVGLCRRYAPLPGMRRLAQMKNVEQDVNIDRFGTWAYVTGEDWCGEFIAGTPPATRHLSQE